MFFTIGEAYYAVSGGLTSPNVRINKWQPNSRSTLRNHSWHTAQCATAQWLKTAGLESCRALLQPPKYVESFGSCWINLFSEQSRFQDYENLFFFTKFSQVMDNLSVILWRALLVWHRNLGQLDCFKSMLCEQNIYILRGVCVSLWSFLRQLTWVV